MNAIKLDTWQETAETEGTVIEAQMGITRVQHQIRQDEVFHQVETDKKFDTNQVSIKNRCKVDHSTTRSINNANRVDLHRDGHIKRISNKSKLVAISRVKTKIKPKCVISAQNQGISLLSADSEKTKSTRARKGDVLGE
jgi:hypothetical protein